MAVDLHGHVCRQVHHFSVIEMDGYRALEPGDHVEFTYEQVQQDSFRCRATRVRKLPSHYDGVGRPPTTA
jgi:hypothetical protein